MSPKLNINPWILGVNVGMLQGYFGKVGCLVVGGIFFLFFISFIMYYEESGTFTS
jgi:ABC-type microcin C transport system permease subunit YejE